MLARSVLVAFRACLLSCALIPVCSIAQENPGFPPSPSPGDCPPNEEGGEAGSFQIAFRIGKARYPIPDMLQIARGSVIEGQRFGGMPRDFDEHFRACYHWETVGEKKPEYELRNVIMGREHPTLDQSVLDPAKLGISRAPGVQVLDKNGAIIQVLTYDTIANVNSLGAGKGYTIEVYPRSVRGPWNVELQRYDINNGNGLPLKKFTVHTSNGAAFTNSVEIIIIDNTNPAARAVFQEFTMDAVTDTITKEVYKGKSSGQLDFVKDETALLEKEVVTYSARGAKVYDYTLLRTTSRAKNLLDGSCGPLVIVGRRQEVYQDFTPISQEFPIGGDPRYKRLMSETDGWLGSRPLCILRTWHQSANPMIQGRVKSIVYPDGRWKVYEYTDSEGAAAVEIRKYSSWLDVPVENYTQGRLEKISVTSAGYARETKINNLLLSTEVFTTVIESDGARTNTLTLKDSANVLLSKWVWRIHSESAAPEKVGRIAWIEHPEGTAESFDYTIPPGTTFDGSFTLTHRKGAGDRDGITAGVETSTNYNSFMEAISEIRSDIASGINLDYWIGSLPDVTGRPTLIEYNGNTNDYETFIYECCGLAEHRSRDGSIETYKRDGLKRVYRTELYRYDGDPTPLITATSFSGLTTTTTQGGILLSEETQDINGEVVSFKSPDQDGDGQPETTSIAYTTTTTATYPDGGTEIRSTYLDGQLKSITGTAVPDVYYNYATASLGATNGIVTTTFMSSTSSAEWKRTYTDALGRVAKVEFPATAPATAIPTVNYAYFPITATKGSITQLQSTTDADGKVTSYLYNPEGVRTTTTEQMPQSQSRVTVLTEDVVDDAQLGPSQRSRTTINGTLVSTDLQSADGHTARSITLAGTSTTARTIATVGGDYAVTTTNSDGTKEVRSFTGNLLSQVANLSTTGAQITATSYGYDSLRRVETITDARTGVTTLSNYTDAGQARARTAPGNRVTTFTFDNMGRVVATDATDTTDASAATLANITRNSYYPTGKIKATWGDQTNPVYHTYDDQNRLRTLRTYRSITLGDEPLVTTTGFDLTVWTFDNRGFLSSKRDAAAKYTNYTYYPGGQLKTREWVRTLDGTPQTARLLTTYTYDKGFLTGTDYNDATPDVALTYDAYGRKVTVTQTSQSKITYAYDPTTLAVDTETVQYDIDHNGSYEFTRVLDRAAVTIGRDNGWELKNGSTVENQVAYAYSPTDGRLTSISNPLISNVPFTYFYVPNSNLIDALTGPVHTVDNIWETDRDMLDIKENKVGSTTVSKYDYSVNAIGQRDSVAATGSAFTGARNVVWGYDPLGQIALANSSEDTHDRAYQYDPIGNRKKSADNLTLPGTNNYATNNLNQYTVANGTALPAGAYDLDGNLVAGRLPVDNAADSTLTWDAENRMTSATVNGTAAAYLYDAQSRRIARSVGGNTTIYVYDAWNVVAEYEGAELTKTYIWGTDLSGTLQGAGGVGGLLAVKQGSAVHYPTFDGNGNVSEYLDGNGVPSAHFEYDPFGNTIVNTDTGNLFTCRFSTKQFDAATGLYYYGYRWYDSVAGRWVSRDPIEEDGGSNLYGFVGNESIYSIDIAGLVTLDHNIGEPNKWTTPDGHVIKRNCLGHAMTGRDNVYIQPRTDGKKSLSETFNDNGWGCFAVKDKSECKCDCKQEKMLMAITQNDNKKNKGKDPYKSRDYEWSPSVDGKYVNEFHAIRGESGCSNNYTEVPGVNNPVQKQDKGKGGTDKYFHGKYKMLCCCKDKKK